VYRRCRGSRRHRSIHPERNPSGTIRSIELEFRCSRGAPAWKLRSNLRSHCIGISGRDAPAPSPVCVRARPGRRSRLGKADGTFAPSRSRLGKADATFAPSRSRLGKADGTFAPSRSRLGKGRSRRGQGLRPGIVCAAFSSKQRVQEGCERRRAREDNHSTDQQEHGDERNEPPFLFVLDEKEELLEQRLLGHVLLFPTSHHVPCGAACVWARSE